MPGKLQRTPVEAGRVHSDEYRDLKEKATLLVNLPKHSHLMAAIRSKEGYDQITPSNCKAVWGMTHGALSKWMNEEQKRGINRASLNKLAQRINGFYEGLADVPRRYPTDLHFLINANKYEFAELLGIQWRDARSILDKNLYVRNHATSFLTMRSGGDMDELDDIHGICMAWHTTPVLIDGTVECRLIRSFFDICDPVSYNENQVIYRCRWRLPYIKKNKQNQDITHYHYLGSVSYTRQNQTFSWLFEPKSDVAVEKNPDFPYFLTQAATDNPEFHFGRYLSKNQDKLIYNSDFAICKVNEEALSDLGIENTPDGLQAYQRLYTEIVNNGVFRSLSEARRYALCDNEKKLLDMFEPTCDLMGKPNKNEIPQLTHLVMS